MKRPPGKRVKKCGGGDHKDQVNMWSRATFGPGEDLNQECVDHVDQENMWTRGEPKVHVTPENLLTMRKRTCGLGEPKV